MSDKWTGDVVFNAIHTIFGTDERLLPNHDDELSDLDKKQLKAWRKIADDEARRLEARLFMTAALTLPRSASSDEIRRCMRREVDRLFRAAAVGQTKIDMDRAKIEGGKKGARACRKADPEETKRAMADTLKRHPGKKTQAVKRLAKLTGLSVATIWRHLQASPGQEDPGRKKEEDIF